MARAGWPRLQAELERTGTGPRGSRSSRRLRGLVRAPLPPGVYILAYHSIVDEAAPEEWELAYESVATPRSRFAAQLAFLCERMGHVPLPEVPAALAGGVTEPLFSLTFDDGYANLVTAAAPELERRGLRPTVFVSSEFASGRDVYYRVLLAVLLRRGHAQTVARALEERLAEPFDPRRLPAQAKDRYRHLQTQAALRDAWERAAPGEPPPHAHLSFDDLRGLVARGWHVGSHTRTHPLLAALADDALDEELSANEHELAEQGLDPVPWLAYPNGRSTGVGARVEEWLERHPSVHGAFGSGGVNRAPSRTEWLRIPMRGETAAELDLRLRTEAARTAAALRSLQDAR